MSDAKANPSGPERRWRKEQPANFRSIQKGGRAVMLALGVVVLAAAIIGTLWWIQPPAQTHLYCYPFGAYSDPHWSPAPWYFNDADRMLHTLPNTGQNVQLRLEKKRFLTDLEQAKHETFIVYVAGRGAVHDNRAYVLPSDAIATDPRTWISLDELMQAMKASPSKNKLLLLDIAGTATSLYTGPLLDRVADAVDAFLSKTPPPFPVFTACAKGEISNVMAVTGTSVFGYYLQQALQGYANGFGGESNDQFITVKELVSFVTTRVNRWATQNIGQAQRPQIYNNDTFQLAHLRNVTALTVATKPADGVPAEDESKLPAEEKKTREKKRKDEQDQVELARLRVIFPDDLEKDWADCDPWLLPMLQLNQRAAESLIEQNEYALRLATLHRYAHTLHRYEDTSSLFKNSMQTGQNEGKQNVIEQVASTLQTNLNDAALLARAQLSKISSEARREGSTSSITALWPRAWLRTKPKLPGELQRAYDAVFSPLAGASAAPAKTEDAFNPQPFLSVVAGKKDEKEKPNPLHLEALFLCWDTLCEDTHLSLEKLKRTEALMKGVIDERKHDKLTARCNELELLRWLIAQSTSTWNYSTNKNVEPLYFEMVHYWLLAEYLAERCANGYLPDGIGFSSQCETLDKLWSEHQAIARKLMADKKNMLFDSELNEHSKQLQSLFPRYVKCLQTIEYERSAFDAWWDAVVALQATAEMMVSEDSLLWPQWEKLAEAALKLSPYLETKSIDETARESIQAVIQARKNLLEPYGNLVGVLLESGKKDAAYLDACRSIERALKSGLLKVADRKALHGTLNKLHQKNHERTLEIEKRDMTGNGQETGQPLPGITSQEQASRRRDISRYLLRLGGLASMQKMSFPSDWQESAAILQKAWTEELPELLKTARDKKDWLAAARIEAVLPQSVTTDALLQWRLKESTPYLKWLQARQLQIVERWK